MLIGHFAVAFAAKKASPKTSLGTFFFASLFVDLICITLLLLGIERVTYDPGNTAVTPLDFAHYPYSHSLFFTVIWATLFAFTYRQPQGPRPIGQRRTPNPQILHPLGRLKRALGTRALLWLIVFSHWLLDVISHGPDLTIDPFSKVKIGFGLWNSIPATLLMEGSFFCFCAFLYGRSTQAADRTGVFAFWGLVIYSLLMYGWVVFFLPEPTPFVLGMAGLGQIGIIAWAYWIDRHRKAVLGRV